MMKWLLFIGSLGILSQLNAQKANCTFKAPFILIHFGTGTVTDVNSTALSNYRRVYGSCPTDGHYSYVPATSNCFNGDWLTLQEDHTPGDANGNMLLVNASHNSGEFLSTNLKGFKGGTTYEFGAWIMNVCRISEKCPFPLLPDITIRIQTAAGKTIAAFGTGDIQRLHSPHWTQHRAVFTMPANETSVKLVMSDNRPGGCGNDFAVDDITFRECVKPITPAPVPAKSLPVKPPPPKTVKKEQPPAVKREVKAEPAPRAGTGTPVQTAVTRSQPLLPPPPAVIANRSNPLVKQIDVEEGEILIALYDNGTIDGDTVSIYHNNNLVVSRARLSQKPVSFRITVSKALPHHELVMVAENLGSIPPNTSVMMVTAGSSRFQVFISSSIQKNAKVVLDLKE